MKPSSKSPSETKVQFPARLGTYISMALLLAFGGYKSAEAQKSLLSVRFGLGNVSEFKYDKEVKLDGYKMSMQSTEAYRAGMIGVEYLYIGTGGFTLQTGFYYRNGGIPLVSKGEIEYSIYKDGLKYGGGVHSPQTQQFMMDLGFGYDIAKNLSWLIFAPTLNVTTGYGNEGMFGYLERRFDADKAKGGFNLVDYTPKPGFVLSGTAKMNLGVRIARTETKSIFLVLTGGVGYQRNFDINESLPYYPFTFLVGFMSQYNGDF